MISSSPKGSGLTSTSQKKRSRKSIQLDEIVICPFVAKSATELKFEKKMAEKQNVESAEITVWEDDSVWIPDGLSSTQKSKMRFSVVEFRKKFNLKTMAIVKISGKRVQSKTISM